MLTARGSKVRGQQIVDLTWNGATSASVDIYRDNVKIATVSNTPSSYRDFPGGHGHDIYTYKVCEMGIQTCSNQVTVTF
jgi:serine protease